MAEPARNLDSSGQGASEQEATARRIAMRQNSLKGGGQGDGVPQGNLSSVGSAPHHMSDEEVAGFNRALDAAEQQRANEASNPETGNMANPAAPTATANQPTPASAPETEPAAAARPNPDAQPEQSKPALGAPGTARTPEQMNALTGRGNEKSGKSGGFAKDQGAPIGGATKAQPSTTRTPDKLNGRQTEADKTKEKSKESNATDAAKGGFVGGLLAGASAAGQFVGDNKKGFLIGGGIAGLLATVVMGFFALLPLKLEALMKAIYREQFGVVENAMERRAEKIFIKYAMQQALSPEGGIVATGNPLGDLYRTWKVQKFEQRLAQSGIKIEKGGTPHSIRLTIEGYTADANSEIALDKFINSGDLKGKTAKRAVNQTLRDYTKWYQVLKRRHLRRWITNAYGIRNWKFFDPKESEKDTKANFNTKLGEAENQGYAEKVGKALKCMMGGECPDGTPESDSPNDATPDEAKSGRDAVTEATEKAVGEAVGEETSEAFAKSLSKKMVSLFTNKLIPIIGLVDLAAHADDFLWNNRFGDIIKDVRKTQYAAVFATWNTMNDQIRDTSGAATVTPAQINATMSTLDTMEKSRAFQELFMGKSAGKDIDKSKSLNPVKDISYIYRHSPAVIQHGPLWLYLHSLGYIVTWIGDLTGWVINLIPGITTVEQWISEILVKMLEWILGPVATGKDRGLVVANAARVGADVVANDFAKEQMGGAPISTKQVMDLSQQLAEEHRHDGTPLTQRLFATSDPSSFIVRFAATLPSSPTSALRNSFDHLVATIAHPMELVNTGFEYAYNAAEASDAMAATATNVDRWGVEHYGYTDQAAGVPVDDKQIADLDTALNNAKADGRTIERIRPTDCPDAGEDKQNICKLNVLTIQALKCMFTDVDDCGFNSDKPELTQGDTSDDTTDDGPTGPGAGGYFRDTSALTCPAETGISNAGVDTGYNSGKPYKIRLCNVQGITVNVLIAHDLNSILNKSKLPKDQGGLGKKLTGGGFRTMADQIAVRKANGCPDIYTSPSSACRVPTARPGYSNHQMGLAIDFDGISRVDHGNPKFIWLGKNAQPPLQNFPKESWHWSVNGK